MKLLKWAIIFVILSILAGGFGFSGAAGALGGVAKLLFGIFLVGALIITVIVIALVRKLKN